MIAAVCLTLLAMFWSVHGHGYLENPPARNTMWRQGFDTPKNYNDMGMNCGGASVSTFYMYLNRYYLFI